MSDRPRVSIVFPVLNEVRDIGSLLGQVLDQVPPPGGFELLVVDGGSSDGTQEVVSGLARKTPNLRLLSNPRRRSSAARNVGAREALGEFVLYLDGHCSLPRRDYLVRLVEIFESSGAACLARPQPLLNLSEGEWGPAIAAARHSPLGHNAGSDIYGGGARFTDPRSAGAAYRREVLDHLGGYDERFDACEDVEFNHRVAQAGMRSFLHPDLSVDYRPRDSLPGLLQQMMRYGRGRARLMARHPSTAPFPLLLITGLLLLLPLLGLMAGWGAALVVGGGLAGLWVLAIGVESIRLGGRRAWRLAAAFGVIYLGLVVGFWRGCLEYPAFRRPGPRPAASAEEGRVHA